ncbi:hypothetical protein AB0N06_35690 [Streptomyces sp. NPDC051020]|uniref:hypothetical protein n=1 Tax=Streptomyces sp. NPDC051020 TaxID=3155409 RepID=UPI00342AB853
MDDGLVAELVARAQAGGVKLTGEGGLLQQLTKRVLESALEGELQAFDITFDGRLTAGRR